MQNSIKKKKIDCNFSNNEYLATILSWKISTAGTYDFLQHFAHLKKVNPFKKIGPYCTDTLVLKSGLAKETLKLETNFLFKRKTLPGTPLSILI